MSLPVPSSTVLVLRDGDHGPEVFLVQRPARSSWLAGAHVFPGGRVEAEDARPEWLEHTGPLPGWWRNTFSSPGEAMAHAIGAIRELFEEVGILLARDTSGELVGDQAAVANPGQRLRADLVGARGTFLDACIEAGWRPALDLLVPLSRWITPEAERRRFDTRFFVAKLPARQEPAVDGQEAVAGRWFGAREAADCHEHGRIVLAPPTLRTVVDLAEHVTTDAVVAAAREGPCPTVSPRLWIDAGTRRLLLPGDPLYPASSRDTLTPPTRFVFRRKRWLLERTE